MIGNKITINGIEYSAADLSDEAKNTLGSLQLVDQKIAQNQQEMAILQTARNAYARALSGKLPVDKQ